MKTKRAVKDEPIFMDEKLYTDLENLAKKIEYNYKSKNKQLLNTRDKAIFAFLLLTGCRVSELQKIKRKQLRIYENRIEAANIYTLKRGLLRKKIILPKIGALKNLTYIFEGWLINIKEPENFVFPKSNNEKIDYQKPLGRKRIYNIIHLTGLFPHWCRGVCETIYAKKIFKNDAYKLKEFMGLKRLESTTPYVQGNWEENEKEIYKL
jgi:integrase